MSEKQVKQTSQEEIASYYRSIGMPVPNDLHLVDVGEHIIQHYVHSYDEHGNVIVVEGDKEDLWQSIPQYKDEVGPKNIIRMIESGADPLNLLNANKANAMYGDFTEMTASSVNEMGEKVSIFDVKAQEALAEFNKKYGVNLDMKTFIDLYDKNLLQSHIEGVKSSTEVIKDE